MDSTGCTDRSICFLSKRTNRQGETCKQMRIHSHYDQPLKYSFSNGEKCEHHLSAQRSARLLLLFWDRGRLPDTYTRHEEASIIAFTVLSSKRHSLLLLIAQQDVKGCLLASFNKVTKVPVSNRISLCVHAFATQNRNRTLWIFVTVVLWAQLQKKLIPYHLKDLWILKHSTLPSAQCLPCFASQGFATQRPAN